MNKPKIISQLESLLFVSGEAISTVRIAKMIGLSRIDLEEAARDLSRKYQKDESCGLMLISHNDSLRLATKSENAGVIESLSKSALQENLSKAALEVLSIIAYRSPITRSEIDAVRGVNCSFTLRNLLLRSLIEREGNPLDARGYIYRPTFRFLEVLGIDNISKLPDFATLSRDERLSMLLENNVVDES